MFEKESFPALTNKMRILKFIKIFDAVLRNHLTFLKEHVRPNVEKSCHIDTPKYSMEEARLAIQNFRRVFFVGGKWQKKHDLPTRKLAREAKAVKASKTVKKEFKDKFGANWLKHLKMEST